jgi:hypothetical protein
MRGMCLNWKVVAGLAVAALGIWLVAGNPLAAAAPLLVALACPLSMAVMLFAMGRMHRDMSSANDREMSSAHSPGADAAVLDAPHRQRMHREQSPVDSPGAIPLVPHPAGQANGHAGRQDSGAGAPAEELAALRAELERTQAEQAAIARRIAELETAGRSPSPPPRS